MSAKGKTTVFIVDDSPIVRERLASMLADLPSVEIVGQADIDFEAINCIRRLSPEAVILDISMPGGSGFNVLEVLKRDSSPPKVIMLTNFVYEQYRQRSHSLGADHFFDKSTEFNKVVDVLRAMA
jgi:DNA-binding NarL/FixJ family response regulator